MAILMHDELDHNGFVFEQTVRVARVGEYNRITFTNNFAHVLVLGQLDNSARKRGLAGPQLDCGVFVLDCADRASSQELAYLRPVVPWIYVPGQVFISERILLANLHAKCERMCICMSMSEIARVHVY